MQPSGYNTKTTWKLLDPKDTAAKLFEQFREPIRELAERHPNANIVYVSSCFLEDNGEENYLWNCIETFKYLDETFYNELKEEILWYIEGEITGD